MNKRTSLLLVPLALVFGGCGPGLDTSNTNRNPFDAGAFLDGSDEAGSNCPENPPKVGERCAPGVTESDVCVYAVGECTAPNGATYIDYLNYCCLKENVWAPCGGMSACDRLDSGAPPPPDDAAAPVDAPADAAPPDARPDVPPDLAPDLAVDAGSDGSDDASAVD